MRNLKTTAISIQLKALKPKLFFQHFEIITIKELYVNVRKSAIPYQ